MSNVWSAVKALIKDGEKFLIVKQVEVGKNMEIWDLPGGRIKYGESPEEALIREVKEEINFDIKVIKPLGLWWFFRFLKENDQVICFTFLCQMKDKKPVDLSKNSQQDEIIAEFKWVTKDEFLAGDYPVSHQSLKELITKL